MLEPELESSRRHPPSPKELGDIPMSFYRSQSISYLSIAKTVRGIFLCFLPIEMSCELKQPQNLLWSWWHCVILKKSMASYSMLSRACCRKMKGWYLPHFLVFLYEISLQCLPRVLEHFLWFMLYTNYRTPSPVKQYCLKGIWLTRLGEVMPLQIAQSPGYRFNFVWWRKGFKFSLIPRGIG